MITEPIYLAAFGALGVQLLALMELFKVQKNRRPDFRNIIYWLPFLIHPLLGAGLGYVYFGDEIQVDRMLAIHIGISAPLIIRTMATVVPNQFQK